MLQSYAGLLQALSQSLNGLNFYSPRPPDSPLHGLYANGVMPAHPNALLDGLQPPDSSFMGQPLLPNMHSMHAAALQQAQLNAQLAAAGMGMPQALEPSALHNGHLDPNAFRAPGTSLRIFPADGRPTNNNSVHVCMSFAKQLKSSESTEQWACVRLRSSSLKCGSLRHLRALHVHA